MFLLIKLAAITEAMICNCYAALFFFRHRDNMEEQIDFQRDYRSHAQDRARAREEKWREWLLFTATHF